MSALLCPFLDPTQQDKIESGWTPQSPLKRQLKKIFAVSAKGMWSRALAALVVSVAVQSPARAQTVGMTLIGSITQGSDYYGFFGPKGADLTGLLVTISVSYIPSNFPTSSQRSCSDLPSAIILNTTINGRTNT